MRNKTINIYTDPGHGWAKVSRADLKRLGLIDKISAYSYQRNDQVYLEEDCDLSLYISSLKDQGFSITFREHVCRERMSKIRGYDHYRASGMSFREFYRIYDRNEDQNRHSDNAVLLADYVGDDYDQSETRKIRKEHERLGGLSQDLYERRNAICSKLWPIALSNRAN